MTRRLAADSSLILPSVLLLAEPDARHLLAGVAGAGTHEAVHAEVLHGRRPRLAVPGLRPPDVVVLVQDDLLDLLEDGLALGGVRLAPLRLEQRVELGVADEVVVLAAAGDVPGVDP